MTSIRVLIVDDHAVVRRGIEAVLNSAVGIEVVGSAASGEAGVRQARELGPDVVLMDLSMPGIGGIVATREILGTTSGDDRRVTVVVLTSFAEESRVLAAMDAGARGYLLKHASPDEIIAAVRTAPSGGVPLDPIAARALLDSEQATRPVPSLTPREREVLDLVAEGLANKQIALRLGIRERTVKAHLTGIFQAVGVSDRTQAALWARDHR